MMGKTGKILLLIAMMNMVASAQTTVMSTTATSPSDVGSGSGDGGVTPNNISLDSNFTTTDRTTTEQGLLISAVIITPISSTELNISPTSLVAFSTSTTSQDPIVTASTTYQTSSFPMTPSSTFISSAILFMIATTPAMSQIISSASSIQLTASSPSLSVVFPSSTPVPTPTLSFSQGPTITPSVTLLSFSSPTEILTAILPSDPTTSNSSNITPMLMVDDTSNPGVPLPVLIAVPVGAVVLISVLFILVVICCMHYRRRRSKYTISSKNNRLSDYAPRSVTPVVPDIEVGADGKKRISNLEDGVANTLVMEFPDTPKYGSNEDIPALIILNPVKPNIEPVSNSLWSRTLPTRQKIRKNTCSESDAPDGLDSGQLKAAKSTGAIDTLTLSTEVANKSADDGTSMTLLLPEAKRKTSARKNDRNDYDHLLSEEEFLQAALGMDGDPKSSLGSTGYVFLEPANTLSEKKPAESSAPDHCDVDLEAKKDLQPSTMPIPSQPPQHMLPTEIGSIRSRATAETESIYDTPKSSGIDIMSPRETKQSTSSGSCSSARDITSSVETTSHYDVPRSALLAYREEAAKQLGFSVQPNSAGAAQEASLVRLSNVQECNYDSLGAGSLRPHSPPYYDIPKLLLQTKNREQKLEKSEGDPVQETNMDDLESSEEHVYCVPPDVAVNNLKMHKSRIEVSNTDNTKTVNTSVSKPVPKKRKKNDKNDNSPRDSVVPAPRKGAGLNSISSSQEELLDKPEAKNDATIGLVPQAPKRTKKPAKGGSGSATSSQEELLDKPESKSDTNINANANAVPAPRPVKKPISNSSASSQPETKGDTNTKVEPAPRPVKKSTSNSSGFLTSSQEKLLDKSVTNTKLEPAPRPVKKSTSSSSGFVTSSQEKLLSKSESKENVKANTPTSILVKKSASSSSDSVTGSQEKLLDKPESKGDVIGSTVPPTRPAKLPMLNDLPGSGATKQLLRELKSLSGTTASPVPKPAVLKKFTKTSLSGSTNNEQVTTSTSPATTSRPLAKKPARASPGSATSSTEKLLNEPEPKNSTAATANAQPPAVSTKPAKKPTKNSPSSITGSMENLLKEPVSKSNSNVSISSPTRSSKPVKKRTHGKSSSDVVATPDPMMAKEPEANAKVAPAPKPAVAKKPALLARTASLEELLSKSNNNVVRPASPKPVVGKKPAIQAKISSSSTTGSLEDLLSQPELKNNRTAPLRPAVAKKPTNPGLAAKKSTSSSAEDLLSTPDPKKVPDIQSATVNGNGPNSDPMCDSPPLVDRVDVPTGAAGDKQKLKSKPKPKIIPRSGSRHAIVQEQGDTSISTNLPSPSTVAPARAPTIPTRPTQRPPPIPQRPEQKPPINA